MDHSSCYIGFFNVRRGWQSLNTEPRFYLRLIRRTGWLWIYTSRTTDGRPFKPKKLSVPFLYHGVPAGYKYMNKKNIVFIQCIEPHFIVTIVINIDILLFYIFQVFQHLKQVIGRPTSVEASLQISRKVNLIWCIWLIHIDISIFI
jgi:hypothetical protein